MFEYISYALELFSNAIKTHSLKNLFHQQVFYKRIAVPVLIDLSADIKPPFPENSEYHIEELTMDDLRANKWDFIVHNRRHVAASKLKQGLRGFVLLEGSQVVGDIWCAAPKNGDQVVRHRDLDMLKISCQRGDCYALDMFVCPEYRDKKVAIPLHRALQLILKQEGWQRIYAYYWNDNVASKWMHWMLKCKELPHLQISRFFFLIKTH